ncbi:MAG: NDP-sugar synthase [Candidatus Auribacterota bacterium]|nr:NDP-sugar synthase [Candidatus Auribacterota bacterium]
MKAIILAAGEGTRLSPLTDDWPKPLFPVGDRPVITYLFELLKRYGIKDIVLNLHHLEDQIESVLGDGSRYSVRISYSEEEDLLGTGGGVRRASRFWKGEDVLVINGDNLLDLNLERLRLTHQATESSATMVLEPMGAHQEYTPIYMDKDSRIEAIGGQSQSSPAYVFIGTQILGSDFIKLFPAKGPACLVNDGYMKVLHSRKKNLRLGGFITTGYWREISTFKGYWEANMDFLRGKSPSYFYRGREEFTRRGLHVGKDCSIGPHVTFNGPVYLGDSCEIGTGTTLGSHALVGAGTTIGERCHLQNVIIWSGSKIRRGSRLQDLIITPFGKVKPL